MKRILLCIVSCLACLSALATGQESDVLYYRGQRWWLLARPADADSSLSAALAKNLPGDRCKSTANWGGYVGYWSIRDSMLVIDSIKVEQLKDGECVDTTLPNSFIKQVFKAYEERGTVVARWYSGTLRLASGKMLRYENDGWNRNYETEMVLTIQNGIIVDSVEYHNRIACEGFDFESLSMQGWDSLQQELRPILKKYPQLQDKERIFFMVSDFSVDPQGNLNDIAKVICHAQLDEKLEQQIALEFKHYLMSIHPWKVLYINGEYSIPQRAWSIPIRIIPK
ncbi:MAG: hypothetical protein IJK84_07315 [Bacteroidales bacterium]|nr:hypothetical protein [Bacteroidales bacterium]